MSDPNAYACSTRTARIEKTPEGIVIVRIQRGVSQSVKDAKENIDAAVGTAKGRCSLLVDVRLAAPLSAETRHFYSGKNLTDHFEALGMVVRASAFGRMMGNVYLRIAKPGIPAMLFSDEAEALAWLAKIKGKLLP